MYISLFLCMYVSPEIEFLEGRNYFLVISVVLLPDTVPSCGGVTLSYIVIIGKCSQSNDKILNFPFTH